MLTRIDPEVLAAGVTFLIGCIDALRRYRKDENIRLYQLPWIEFRALFEFARRRFFTIDKPDHPSFVLEGYTVDQLKRELGKQGVKPRHPFSYRYAGEKYNGVLYVFNPDKGAPHRQIHIRAFQEGEKLRVMAHSEPHWWHHPIKHIKSNDMEYDKANKFAESRLTNPVPIDYEE